MKGIISFFLLLISLSTFAVSGAPALPPHFLEDDEKYQLWLDQLHIVTPHRSHKPLSLRYLAHILEECRSATDCLENTPEFYFEWIDERLLKASKALDARPLEYPTSKVALRTNFNNSARRLKLNRPQGSLFTNQVFSTLTEYEHELRDFEGLETELSSLHEFYFSEKIGLQIQPRVLFQIRESQSDKVIFDLGPSYLTFDLLEKWRLTLGRQRIRWGGGLSGQLLMDNAHQPIDGILFGNDIPIRHPWFFRHLGQAQYSFFLGNLVGRADYPYTWIYASRFSLSPHPRFEISHQQSLLFGGQGAPSIAWYEIFTESYTPLKRQQTATNQLNPADHRMAFDIEWLLWKKTGLRLEAGLMIDDWRKRMFDSFRNFNDALVEQLTKKLGIRFNVSDRAQMRFYYLDAPLAAYRHGDWFEGYTINSRNIGFPLGSGVRQFLFKVRRELSASTHQSLQLSHQNRQGNSIVQGVKEPNGITRVIKRENLPSEQSITAIYSHRFRVQPQFFVDISAGGEMVFNNQFEEGKEKFNQLVDIRLEYLF